MSFESSSKTGNNKNTLTLGVNILKFRELQEGTYKSLVTSVLRCKDSSEKLEMQYHLVDEEGHLYWHKETFIFSYRNQRWREFTDYLVTDCNIKENSDVSSIKGLTEIVKIENVDGFLNIVERTYISESFDPKDIKTVTFS